MIVAMKKVTIICLKSKTEQTLSHLQDLAVVHLQHIKEPKGESLQQAQAKLLAYNQAAALLDKYVGSKDPADNSQHPQNLREAEKLIAETLDLDRKLAVAKEELTTWAQELELRQPLGDYDQDALKKLEKRGLTVRVFLADRRSFERAKKIATVVLLKRERRDYYFAVVAKGTPEVAAKQIDILAHSLQEVSEKVTTLKQEISLIEARLQALALRRESLKWCTAEAEDQLRLLEAKEGMAIEKAVSYLQGFCPAVEIPRLKEAASNNSWGLLIEEVDESETVPTKIDNPGWVSLISPIFKLIGVVPGYKEFDISPVFLFAFTLFFSMIVGDAGYGAVYLLLTLIFRKPLLRFSKQAYQLLLLLSTATILWGGLQGQYFAIKLNEGSPLKSFVIDWLTEANNLMLFCFAVGAVHLTIAHIWNIIRFSNRLFCLAQLGWIMATWTMFFMARNMVLGQPLPDFVPLLFGIGLTLIVLFMTPLNQLKKKWFSHAMLPLTLIGSFVDVISYLRLFAVGMATLMVASAFNEIIMAFAFSSLTTGLVGVVVLLLAHSLNLLLALMGVIVHGVRLNVLEFVGRLDVQWAGVHYTPFARKTKLVRAA